MDYEGVRSHKFGIESVLGNKLLYDKLQPSKALRSKFKSNVAPLLPFVIKLANDYLSCCAKLDKENSPTTLFKRREIAISKFPLVGKLVRYVLTELNNLITYCSSIKDNFEHIGHIPNLNQLVSEIKSKINSKIYNDRQC